MTFYRDVLGATVLREGEPTFLHLGNIWITINRGGGGTDDKPEVIVAPTRDPNLQSTEQLSQPSRSRQSWSRSIINDHKGV